MTALLRFLVATSSFISKYRCQYSYQYQYQFQRHLNPYQIPYSNYHQCNYCSWKATTTITTTTTTSSTVTVIRRSLSSTSQDKMSSDEPKSPPQQEHKELYTEHQQHQLQDQSQQQSINKFDWVVCPSCHGEGKLFRIPSRKSRLRQKRAKTEIGNDGDSNSNSNNNNNETVVVAPLQMRADPCNKCDQTGLVSTQKSQSQSQQSKSKHQHDDLINSLRNSIQYHDYPKIAIIGGGLGGLALAVACQHRKIPYRVFERDLSFSERSQGYGLTMQQASRALSSFGITQLDNGITSTKHVVHNTDGTVVGEWGLRKWGRDTSKRPPKRQNVHIARQALRQELLDRVDPSNISWGSKLISIKTKTYLPSENGNSKNDDNNNNEDTQNQNDKKVVVELEFLQNDQDTFTHTADLVVGADGIRSTVRQYLVSDDVTPLRYLDCLVVLGICPLEVLPPHHLLDGQTVFQTADGNTRIYCMPFSKTQYMWQLSFPMDEALAKQTSLRGPKVLKQQALTMCDNWHSPIPEILQSTPEELVSGYPVYDRDILTLDMLLNTTAADCEDLSTDIETTHGQQKTVPITLIGDAAHPMSPFKGQGANQALLDALVLARSIYSQCYRDNKNKKTNAGTNNNEEKNNTTNLLIAIDQYHQEMITRSAKKVQASAEAAQFLHSEVAIQEGNVTRGAAAATSVSCKNKGACKR